MVSYHLLIAVAAISMLISILAFTVALDGFEIRPAMDYAETKPLSPDAIYLGGATLIGLATFGSVIGTRLIKGSNDAQEKRGVVLMFAGLAGLITAQGILMFFACCWRVNTGAFYVWHTITLVFAIITVLGLGYIVEALFRSSSSKSHAPG